MLGSCLNTAQKLMQHTQNKHDTKVRESILNAQAQPNPNRRSPTIGSRVHCLSPVTLNKFRSLEVGSRGQTNDNKENDGK
jgi:hypothetical protein